MGNLPPSVVFRHPPPPHRHLIMANNEERNTAAHSCLAPQAIGTLIALMVGGSCVPAKFNIRPYYLRRCKSMRPTNIESHISDDLLFEILVHLPAQDIYDLARLVCWKWYRMIRTRSFIYAHLNCSRYGLLIQSVCLLQHPIFVSMRQGGPIEISNFSYEFNCAARTGCNGLVIGIEYAVGIAYAAASMEYKVVHPDFIGEIQLYILTVGIDSSWRPVYSQHLSSEAKDLFFHCPLINEGFVHWAKCSYRVLTLNVETETVTETSVPLPDQEADGEKLGDFFYMSTGRYLSLLIAFGKFSWRVWEMKPESGKWTNLPDIDLEAQKCRFGHVESPVPVGWLNYPEVLVFRLSIKSCAVYNLVTHEFHSITLPTLRTCCWSVVHRNTLVWLTGS
ncbi:hypothetical protein OROHE_025245 [Orobanche hederae]